MKTVQEVSRLSGMSVRALQYYDTIGLLRATDRTEAGYRLYDDAALYRLSEILLLRTLGFRLGEIRTMMERKEDERLNAIDDQIRLLEMKKEQVESLLLLAREIKRTGGKTMDFSAFNTKKQEAYQREAQKRWGQTEAFREHEERSAGRTPETEQALAAGLMNLFGEFGAIRHEDPACEAARNRVAHLQAYITDHYYTCTDEILAGLATLYVSGGEMTESIDRAGGEGTADFVSRSIESALAFKQNESASC